MAMQQQAVANPKWMTAAGWILTALLTLLLGFSATMKLLAPAEMVATFTGERPGFGYPEHTLLPIGVVEIACAVLFLFPRTAVLGAILLTGYLGGATATHVRVDDHFFGPVLIGVLAWLAVYLREPRLRAILPLR